MSLREQADDALPSARAASASHLTVDPILAPAKKRGSMGAEGDDASLLAEDVASPLQSPPGSPRTQRANSASSISSHRSRSRSRTDSYLRKQRQRMQQIEASNSTVLLVTNLRPGSHSALLDMLRTSVGPAALKTVLLDPEFNFGFVEFQEKEAMLAGLRYISGLEVGGATLSAERCAEITPGRNPLVLEELGPPTDTIVVKNLVFTASEAAFRDELKTATPHCEDPCDVRYRLNSQGQFMGMAFVQYTSVDAAERACQMLNGMDLLGRKVRVEYKRAEPSTVQQKQRLSYEPPNAECAELYQTLLAFKAGSELTMRVCVPVCGKKQVHSMAEALHLRHATEEGEVRIWKASLSPLPLRRIMREGESEAGLADPDTKSEKSETDDPRPRAHSFMGRPLSPSPVEEGPRSSTFSADSAA